MNDFEELFDPLGCYHIIYYHESKAIAVIHKRFPKRNQVFYRNEPWETIIRKFERVPYYMQLRVIKIMKQEWTKEVND